MTRAKLIHTSIRGQDIKMLKNRCETQSQRLVLGIFLFMDENLLLLIWLLILLRKLITHRFISPKLWFTTGRPSYSSFLAQKSSSSKFCNI